MSQVKGEGHTFGLVSNWFASFSFYIHQVNKYNEMPFGMSKTNIR